MGAIGPLEPSLKNKFKIKMDDQANELLFNVDYLNDEGLKPMFRVELSFTILDWIMVEAIRRDDNYDLEDIDKLG